LKTNKANSRLIDSQRQPADPNNIGFNLTCECLSLVVMVVVMDAHPVNVFCCNNLLSHLRLGIASN